MYTALNDHCHYVTVYIIIIGNYVKPSIQRVQALADISHSVLRCHNHSKETCALSANPRNSAQLESNPIIPPSNIRVHAAVWECGEEQTDRHRGGRDQHTFHLGYVSCEM